MRLGRGNRRSRVLLVCDRPNWAYDAIARALVRHDANARFALDIFHLKGREDELSRIAPRYGAVFVLGWQLLASLEDGEVVERLELDPDRTLTGIHSHHAWDSRQTTPERSVPPPENLVAYLSRFRGVNAVSRRLTDLFRGAGLDEVAYTPNGVDTKLFRPDRPPRLDGPLRVGFSGSKKHDWRKGISEFIEPAAREAGAELRLAMPVEKHHVPLNEMARFYNDIDVYVCASSSEGFSLSVLEASACGRPVVSTHVGGSEDLIENGVNGFIVDRDVEAIRERLEFFRERRGAVMEMGRANRALVEERWSWSERAPAWHEFVAGALEHTEAAR